MTPERAAEVAATVRRRLSEEDWLDDDAEALIAMALDNSADRMRAALLGTITWIDALQVKCGTLGFTANEVEQLERNLVMWRNLLGDQPSKPRAVITLTDGDEDGEVNCSIDFIPPVEKGGRGTPAQAHALEMLGASLKKAQKHSEPVFHAPRRRKR